MRYERVKEIVQRYYEQHDSKYIYGGRSLSKDYFFNTSGWDWYVNYAKSLSDDFLSHPDAPNNLTFNFYADHKYSKSKCDFFIKLSVNEHLQTEIQGYAITGLILANTYGKIGLKLKLSERSVFTILMVGGNIIWKNGRGMYNHFDFNWWLNRLLRENERFRLMLMDIFDEFAETHNWLAVKDVVRTIKQDHFFLPNMSFEQLEYCHTPDELIRYVCGRDSDICFNNWNLNAAYYAKKISEHIKIEDEGMLFQIPQDKLLRWIGKRDLFDGPHLDDFAAHYYADKLDGDEERIRMVARDYARMSIQNGEKISLRKNSINGLEEEHDRYIELMMDKEQKEEFSKPLIADNTRFAKLREMLPEEFVWIDNTRTLYSEGKKQRNCVYSYKDRIRRDECTIYHWSHENKEYTIEFVRSTFRDSNRGAGHYQIAQMLQSCNQNADPQDREMVESYIRGTNENREEVSENIEDWI